MSTREPPSESREFARSPSGSSRGPSRLESGRLDSRISTSARASTRRPLPVFPEPPISLWPDPEALGPVTDLYQLTMMAGYAASGKERDRAVFELFTRRLPPDRAYLVFAGLEQAIGDLLRLAFSREQ